MAVPLVSSLYSGAVSSFLLLSPLSLSLRFYPILMQNQSVPKGGSMSKRAPRPGDDPSKRETERDQREETVAVVTIGDFLAAGWLLVWW